MKVLLIDFNAKYINPTNQLAHRAFQLISTVIPYGPGFVSDNVLEAGIHKFIEVHGPFDFLVTTTRFAVFSDPLAAEKFYKDFSVCMWGQFPVSSYMNDIFSFITTSSLTKIVLALDLDPYALSDNFLCRLDAVADYIICPGPGFTLPLAQLSFLTRESNIMRKQTHTRLGLWHEYALKNSFKIINLGHFVDISEFNFSPLSNRPLDISVPGQLYYYRSKYLQQLRCYMSLSVGSTSYSLIFRFLSRLGISPYSQPIMHNIYRSLFQQLIINSRICMTDGGAYEFMIRKFFEIPASGSLLLARPCAGFADLGFVDGVSAIIIDEDKPVEQVLSLLEDPDRIQLIASCGQRLVWTRHSIQARASQLNSCLKSISLNQFRGSAWNNGEFILN